MCNRLFMRQPSETYKLKTSTLCFKGHIHTIRHAVKGNKLKCNNLRPNKNTVFFIFLSINVTKNSVSQSDLHILALSMSERLIQNIALHAVKFGFWIHYKNPCKMWFVCFWYIFHILSFEQCKSSKTST